MSEERFWRNLTGDRTPDSIPEGGWTRTSLTRGTFGMNVSREKTSTTASFNSFPRVLPGSIDDQRGRNYMSRYTGAIVNEDASLDPVSGDILISKSNYDDLPTTPFNSKISSSNRTLSRSKTTSPKRSYAKSDVNSSNQHMVRRGVVGTPNIFRT